MMALVIGPLCTSTSPWPACFLQFAEAFVRTGQSSTPHLYLYDWSFRFLFASQAREEESKKEEVNSIGVGLMAGFIGAFIFYVSCDGASRL